MTCPLSISVRSLPPRRLRERAHIVAAFAALLCFALRRVRYAAVFAELRRDLVRHSAVRRGEFFRQPFERHRGPYGSFCARRRGVLSFVSTYFPYRYFAPSGSRVFSERAKCFQIVAFTENLMYYYKGSGINKNIPALASAQSGAARSRDGEC